MWMQYDNSCGGFWGTVTKYSNGKRINGTGTDLWESMLELCFCNNNGRENERAREELSLLLNMEITEVEIAAHHRSQKKREYDYTRNNSVIAAKRRLQSKMAYGLRMQKQDAKKKHNYKSDKVSVNEMVKMKSTLSKCNKCGEVGHTTRQCPTCKPPKKRKTTLFNRNDNVCSKQKFTPSQKKNKPNMYDWSNNAIIKK